MNTNCIYCMYDERLKNLMIEICQLEVSTLFLFKEQTHRGRVIVAYNQHTAEVFDLDDSEAAAFMKDVSQAAKAVFKTVKPDKMNYGAYGDKMPHLHMHIVPKYEDMEEWGSTFEMNPGNVYLTDHENEKLIAEIISNL